MGYNKTFKRPLFYRVSSKIGKMGWGQKGCVMCKLLVRVKSLNGVGLTHKHLFLSTFVFVIIYVPSMITNDSLTLMIQCLNILI